MSKKRMFSAEIIDSDAFMDMPLSAQALYFHLNMRADDDGFVNNPKTIQKLIGASPDDLTILKAKSFIIEFESGIVVIKHWLMNNTIRKDRYKITNYLDERALLSVKENGAYTLGVPNGNQMATNGKPSIDKYSIDKYRLDKNNKEINKEEKVELFEYDWLGDTNET